MVSIDICLDSHIPIALNKIAVLSIVSFFSLFLFLFLLIFHSKFVHIFEMISMAFEFISVIHCTKAFLFSTLAEY